MGLIFTLLSVIYAWTSLKTAREFFQRRATLFDERLTQYERALFDRGAFFLLIPIGVLLHELGHAAATWQVGGTVERFRWFMFWGYIIPKGDFSPLQDWWIALAGNVVSVLLGVAAAALALVIVSRPWRYWLASFARLEFFYSLIFYPAFSLLTQFGDFQMIYGPLLTRAGLGGNVTRPFSSPELFGPAAATALVHCVVLAGLVALDRHPDFRRWLLLRTTPPGLGRLIDEARDAPDAEASMRMAEAYAHNGDTLLANAELEAAALRFPNDPRPPFGLARIAADAGRHDRALKLYDRALTNAPLGATRLRAMALEGIADAELAHGRPAAALDRMGEAVDLLEGAGLEAEAEAMRTRRAELSQRLGKVG